MYKLNMVINAWQQIFKKMPNLWIFSPFCGLFEARSRAFYKLSAYYPILQNELSENVFPLI